MKTPQCRYEFDWIGDFFLSQSTAEGLGTGHESVGLFGHSWNCTDLYLDFAIGTPFTEQR